MLLTKFITASKSIQDFLLNPVLVQYKHLGRIYFKITMRIYNLELTISFVRFKPIELGKYDYGII